MEDLETIKTEIQGVLFHSRKYGSHYTIDTGRDNFRHVLVMGDTKVTVNGSPVKNAEDLVKFLKSTWGVSIEYVRNNQKYGHTESVNFYNNGELPK